MKKTLIALAAVAAATGAMAQNVTISGRLDMGTVSDKRTTSGDGIEDVIKNSTLAGANGTKTGSRITFAGTEDLGGGLTAFFNIESSLNNSSIGNRNLFVGAHGAFGSVQIGRYLNTFSAIRDSHYSIAGGAGGAFLNQHLNFVGNPLFDNESVAEIFGFTTTPVINITGTDVNLSGTATDADNTSLATYITDSSDLVAQNSTGGIIDPTTASGVSELNSVQTVASYNATARANNNARVAVLRSLMANGIANRSNNTLAYTTPAFNGFTATVGLVNDKLEATTTDTDFGGKNQAKVKGQSLSIAYTGGPLAARLTTGTGKATTQSMTFSPRDNEFNGRATTGPTVGESSAKTSDTALMVSYNFGVAQAYLMNNRTKSTLQMFRGAAVNGTSLKTNATEIGVKAPMGNVEPFVTIGRGTIKTQASGVETASLKTSAYQIGANYNLSKRTSVYVSYGQDKLKDSEDFTSKRKGYTAGIVHMF